MSQCFPKPYRAFEGNVKVELDLSSYATKTDLTKATGIDTSKLAAKSDFASLKAEVDKIDLDLSKLSNVVKNEVVKKKLSMKN